jgi:hypothetical protein
LPHHLRPQLLLLCLPGLRPFDPVRQAGGGLPEHAPQTLTETIAAHSGNPQPASVQVDWLRASGHDWLDELDVSGV